MLKEERNKQRNKERIEHFYFLATQRGRNYKLHMRFVALHCVIGKLRNLVSDHWPIAMLVRRWPIAIGNNTGHWATIVYILDYLLCSAKQ